VLVLADPASKQVSFTYLDFWSNTQKALGQTLTGNNIPDSTQWCPISVNNNPMYLDKLEVVSFCSDKPKGDQHYIYTFSTKSAEMATTKVITWNLLDLDSSIKIDSAIQNSAQPMVCSLGNDFLVYYSDNGTYHAKIVGQNSIMFNFTDYGFTSVDKIICSEGGSMFVVRGTKSGGANVYGVFRANEFYNANNRMVPLIEIPANATLKPFQLGVDLTERQMFSVVHISESADKGYSLSK